MMKGDRHTFIADFKSVHSMSPIMYASLTREYLDMDKKGDERTYSQGHLTYK